MNTPQVEEYARDKNVMLASPNTISYFLKVVLVAYRQHELQKHTSKILAALSGIKVETEKFGEDLDVLGRHISNSYKSMEGVKGRFTKISDKLDNVHTLDKEDEPPKLV